MGNQQGREKASRRHVYKPRINPSTVLAMLESLDSKNRPPGLCNFCRDIVTLCRLPRDAREYPLRDIDVLIPPHTAKSDQRLPLNSFVHFSGYDALLASAHDGCTMCCQFVDSLPKSMPQGPMVTERGRVVGNIVADYECPGETTLSLTVKLDVRAPTPTLQLVRNTNVGEMNSGKVTLASGYHVDSSARINAGLEQCAAWLARCENLHPCGTVGKGRKSPTRLLCVEKGKLRLCIPELELDFCPKYATLSHRWGTSSFLRLEKNNLRKFQRTIQLDALSRTFHDAVQVVRCLGIKYLWIDSLCIIQDDADDWRQESSLMSSIYGNSTVNLAASAGVDGMFSCLADRKISWRCEVNIRDSLYDCVPLTYNRFVDESPLTSRGWVMQERILAHRTLHFTVREIFWECDHSSASETFVDKIPAISDFQRWTAKALDSGQGWKTLVESYSRCKLTFNTDKLVAISGLAQLVKAKTGDEYIAGIWKSSLLAQVCYTTRSSASKRISPYAAPTWSWASIDDAIAFPYYIANEVLGYTSSVFGTDVGHTSSNEFGQVLSATLHLSSRFVFRIEIVRYQSRDGDVGDNAEVKLASGKRMMITTYADERETIGSGSQVYFIAIHSRHIPASNSDETVGLILERTMKQGQYQRVGLFVVTRLEADRVLKELIKDESQVFDSDCERVSFDPDGNRHCYISIV